MKIANWMFEPNKGLPKPDYVSSVMTELIFVVWSEPNHEFIRTGRLRFCSANVKIISDWSGMEHLIREISPITEF